MPASVTPRYRPLSFWPLLAVLVLALVLVVGCESSLDAPQSLTLETNSALSVLPADAQMAGMVRVADFAKHPALSPLSDDGASLWTMGSEAGARYAAFLEATQFDPARDLEDLYLAMSEGSDGQPRASLVAYASFDRDRMLDHLDQLSSGGLTQHTYGGVQIFETTTEDGQAPDLAFSVVNDNMILAASDAAQLKGMIGRLTDRTRGLDANPDLMPLIQSAATGQSGWIVMHGLQERAGPRSSVTPASSMDQIGQAVQDMAIALDLTDTGLRSEMMLVTTPNAAARDVASLARGAVAGMKASADLDPAMLRALDRVEVRHQGERVYVEAQLDPAALEALSRGTNE
ncbi:MAG: DUF3352 domain-containing protein [Bacteroidota bacterium]